MLRRVGVLLAVTALVFAALIVIAWYQLPSWSAVRRTDAWLEARVRATPTPTPPLPQPTPPLTATGQTRLLPPLKRSPGSLSLTVLTYLTDRFVNRQGPPIRICENLWSESPRAPETPLAFTQELEHEAAGAPSQNVFVEIALIPISQLLRLSAFAKLARADQGEFDYLSSDEFRSTVALASAQAIEWRAGLTRSSEHAYDLGALARVAILRPALADDAEMLDLCNHEESLALDPRTAARESRAQLDQARGRILRLLANNGLSPEQVEFDPGMHGTVAIQVSEASFSITTPWTERIYGLRFTMNNTAPSEGTESATSRGPSQNE